MRVVALLLIGILAIPTFSPAAEPAATLQLNPDNPHYFLFRGKPTVLITSGEHYGSVLNLDIDYAKYLQTLARDGFNLTRTFTGVYCEPDGAFGIVNNTLSPKPGRLITPWARSNQSGAWDGGNKWDLTQWNEEYFARFRDFLSQASKQGVVVEVNLFCPFYDNGKTMDSKMWPLSPMNASNNTNGLGHLTTHDVYTLDRNGGLLAVQDRLVRRLVEEFKDFDNLYYEICNEPYFAGVTLDWQNHIAGVITDAQKSHPHPKLISQNIANFSAKIQDPNPAVSIFNFHYTHPPQAVAENFGLNKVIGENETGFRGHADETYRGEAWDFLLAGGGLFNNLDYSFTAGHEDGTFALPPSTPGGGGVAFRSQLAVLVKFMNAIDFVHMKPAQDIIPHNPGFTWHLLANPGHEYAGYFHRILPKAKAGDAPRKAASESAADSLELAGVPAGKYDLAWIEPATGKVIREKHIDHAGGALRLETPAYSIDLALHLKSGIAPRN